MCIDNYEAKTIEQVAMDTKARLERIERELPKKEQPQEVKPDELFECAYGVNW